MKYQNVVGRGSCRLLAGDLRGPEESPARYAFTHETTYKPGGVSMCTAAGISLLLPHMGTPVLVTDGGAACEEWSQDSSATKAE